MLSFLKKYKNPILNIIVSLLCVIIIYESIFVDIRYWRTAIFGLLLIFKITELIGFWKNNQNSNK